MDRMVFDKLNYGLYVVGVFEGGRNYGCLISSFFQITSGSPQKCAIVLNRDNRTCEALLKEGFEIVKAEHIPIRQIPEITDVPLIWRYFLAPMQSVLNRLQLDAEEYVARIVTKINAELRGAYVFSSGKNMGTFKAVGQQHQRRVFGASSPNTVRQERRAAAASGRHSRW